MIYSLDIYNWAGRIKARLPSIGLDDILPEVYIAAQENKVKDLTYSLQMAVIDDVKDVFRSCKWSHSYDGNFDHVNYGLYLNGECETVTPCPENEYIDNMTVDKLLEPLDDESRELIIDRYWHGYTSPEIGKKLGMGSSGARHRHMVIMNKIRDNIEEDHHERHIGTKTTTTF